MHPVLTVKKLKYPPSLHRVITAATFIIVGAYSSPLHFWLHSNLNYTF